MFQPKASTTHLCRAKAKSYMYHKEEAYNFAFERHTRTSEKV